MKKHRVYYNLHKSCWSIKDPSTGLVIGHATDLALLHPKGIVSEAGRQRVLREGRKNVHAYIEGEIVTLKGFKPYKGRTIDLPDSLLYYAHASSHRTWLEVYYNPYKRTEFMVTDYGLPLNLSPVSVARFTNERKVYVK